jgi:hypothetical protein
VRAPFVISFVVAGSLLGTTAHAQTATEAGIGLSFELDDYVTEQREQWGFNPSAYWSGNSNVSAPTNSPPYVCYHVPGRLNASKGKGILSSKPGSVIYELLSSLGQSHSHSGMARDSQRIRHNTMIESQVRKNEDSLGVPFALKATGEKSLREGYPGTATHSVESAVTYREFNIPNGLVLSGSSSYAPATELVNADAEFADFRGWYRLFAYTDMTWRDPYSRGSDDGNMCSGTMFYAHLMAGNRGWSWSQRRNYPSDTRQGAAATLYNNVRQKVIDDRSFAEKLGLAAYPALGGTNLITLADNIANQMVNCMAFDDCGNTTWRWRQGVGTGASLSPDDLMLLVYTVAFTAARDHKNNTFAWATVKPVEKTGDYICCTRTVFENGSPPGFPPANMPFAYTQCLKNY